MIINEKYIMDIDDEDDDDYGKIENNTATFDSYPIEWKIVIYPDNFIDLYKLDESNFEIDAMMDNIEKILDDVYFIERYKYEVKIYPFINPKEVANPKEVTNYLKSENGYQITNDNLYDFSDEINKIFDKAYSYLTTEQVAFAICVDIKFALTDRFSYNIFCKSFGVLCGYFD